MTRTYRICLSGRDQSMHGRLVMAKSPPTVQIRVGTKKFASLCAELAKKGEKGPQMKLQRLLATPIPASEQGEAWLAYLAKLSELGRLPKEQDSPKVKRSTKSNREGSLHMIMSSRTKHNLSQPVSAGRHEHRAVLCRFNRVF